ncbi:MAG: chemotaxis protein CheA [Deltaproteobacteria bacterium]|nr:chemotaxis protein CheA [Deltaproteobacteria bacterium]
MAAAAALADRAAPPSGDHGPDPRIRVDVGTLDRLMNLVGELVLARNQLVNAAANIGDSALAATVQRVNLITGELQEGVMKTRMQPIQSVWSRYPRVVRDLAASCGKLVRLDVEGAGTELDRSIIEAIADPLTHLVRNAIDHGIEAPSTRLAAGKPDTGRLQLRAYHEGGRVNIELADDGAGIDPAAVTAKAVERGLITAARASQLSPQEIYNLIFLPGFSTAKAVSNLSGRGVGMDVVRTNVERIGGSVEIESTIGRGTTVRIRIPLTLAIIPALIVGTREERFAIPQVNLLELLLIEAEAVGKTVERIHGVPVMRLRGRLLALVDLAGVLGLDDPGEEPRDWHVVVVQADGVQFGLVVQDIFDTEEIVVKPIGRGLRGLEVYPGATIMGDGKVALILDVNGLANKAGVRAAERQIAARSATAAPKKADAPRSSYLLLRTGAEAPMALPLSSVDRLEEFDSGIVERVGGSDCIQYRGEILELVYLADLFGGSREPSDVLRVVVHTSGEKSLGFVVEEIADVVEPEVGFVRQGGRRGVCGSMVIQGKVTEILDAETVHAMANGAF